MTIKELIELLHKIKNQDDVVYQITVGAYSNCIIIDYEDERKSVVIEK